MSDSLSSNLEALWKVIADYGGTKPASYHFVELAIQEGYVKVNGEVEYDPNRKLVHGDVVNYDFGSTWGGRPRDYMFFKPYKDAHGSLKWYGKS